jgi:hypothetical protein
MNFLKRLRQKLSSDVEDSVRVRIAVSKYTPQGFTTITLIPIGSPAQTTSTTAKSFASSVTSKRPPRKISPT